jgi:hypothetical protein
MKKKSAAHKADLKKIHAAKRKRKAPPALLLRWPAHVEDAVRAQVDGINAAGTAGDKVMSLNVYVLRCIEESLHGNR